ncbi:MAG: hypothetical protein QOF24_2645 [Verrucomicrobiota bacterium]
MAILDIRIVGAIDRAERTVAGDATREFFLGLVPEGFFDGIGATADENRARDTESDREGLQERRILKKVTSDK